MDIKIEEPTRVVSDTSFASAPVPDLAAQLNPIIQRLASNGLKTDNVSDGYHTFGELYEHRGALLAALCRACPNSWWSRKHADGTMYDGMFIAGMNTPAGPISYHLELTMLPYFAGIREVKAAPEFDGYTSDDVLDRLNCLYADNAPDGMDFGDAVKLLKSGVSMSRKGWNGKNLRVVYQPGYPNGIPCNVQTAKAWGLEPGETFKCEPYLQINTVDGSHAMWVPSIRDCLADDWFIVE